MLWGKIGASFNNLLDALDGSFCTFEGGDDPYNDGIYPDTDTYPNGFNGSSSTSNVTKHFYLTVLFPL